MTLVIVSPLALAVALVPHFGLATATVALLVSLPTEVWAYQ